MISNLVVDVHIHYCISYQNNLDELNVLFCNQNFVIEASIRILLQNQVIKNSYITIVNESK